jgi:hypothetical protein
MKLNLLAGALCVSFIFSAPSAKALTITEIVQLEKLVQDPASDLSALTARGELP